MAWTSADTNAEIAHRSYFERENERRERYPRYQEITEAIDKQRSEVDRCKAMMYPRRDDHETWKRKREAAEDRIAGLEAELQLHMERIDASLAPDHEILFEESAA